MRTTRALPATSGILIAVIILLGAADPTRAQSMRETHCGTSPAPAAPALPADTLSFAALTAAHVQSVTVAPSPIPQSLLRATVDRGGRFNEAEEGAVLAAVTGGGRPAKLVVTVSGSGLLIRRLTTYAPDGATVADATNLWVAAGKRIDLDHGVVTTDERAAHLRWAARARRLVPLNGTRVAVLRPRIAVPVIVHVMARRGSGFDPGLFMRPAALDDLFAAEGELNRIWDAAGLVFFLAGADRCAYAVRDLIPEEPEPAVDGIPSPAGDCRALYRRLNRVYNVTLNEVYGRPADAGSVYGADLYLWMRIGLGPAESLFGYAAQHRPDGPNPGPGAIWINAALCRAAEAGCAARVAHEVGHFLGLCHVCVTDATTPVAERGLCGFCTEVRTCAPRQAGLLMRDDAAGTRLTPAEIRGARRKALEHRWRGGSP